jgi:hypothetical protein
MEFERERVVYATSRSSIASWLFLDRTIVVGRGGGSILDADADAAWLVHRCIHC